uniref:NADH-ubiquinone oxidoreductase chain 2 n=1 Tax=Amanita bisporigera TaxID=87325 RepID=A0A5Q0N2M8_AMABI|nr:NADH dehydrogenase subunit 2 [Amanita bisporigera]QFZ98550.1 NADH dehydrogenase subunit 2 [Amanita bisporigera]
MIFISILTLIVAKALPSLNIKLSPVYFTRISAIIFIYAGALSFNTLYIQSIGSGIGIYSGLFQITQVSQLIEIFLLVIGALILIAWPLTQSTNNTIKIMNIYSTDYSLIVLFSTLGSCLLISCSDLISMYLSIELQSFGLYILSTLYRYSESSTSAGLKYFLLGGLSSCIILLGSGLIYAYTGLTNFESIYSLISISEYNHILQGLSLGLILILVGFLFKIAAAPLHNWSPDVYDDTPTIVTIWLTIMPKIAIIILLLELHTQIGIIGGATPSVVGIIINPSGYAEVLNSIEYNSLTNLSNITSQTILDLIGNTSMNIIKNLLLISSFLSLIIGTVVGLAQTRIKRLLAYSTISHIGFILLALAINSEQSIDSLLFYIIQYSITNLNIFLIIIALGYIINNSTNKDQTMKDIKYISEFKGNFFFNPLLSLSLAVCLFSMAGIPPLMGFFSKQFVLYSAVQNGYNFISIVAILVSVVSASYYLKIIKVLHTYPENEDTNSLVENNSTYFLNKGEVDVMENTILTNFHSYLISSLTLSILLFILKPSLILNSTQLLSLSLFNL